jgi:hypothetical protein
LVLAGWPVGVCSSQCSFGAAGLQASRLDMKGFAGSCNVVLASAACVCVCVHASCGL